jgi:hypothetical protein
MEVLSRPELGEGRIGIVSAKIYPEHIEKINEADRCPPL